MGHSQAQKAENRERILTLAAEQIRAEGIDSLSVLSLMTAAGLTHGGFYGHFESRDALVTAAIERALADGAAGAARAKGRTLSEIARSYLSRRHRDAPQSGCAIAAIGGETARADVVSRTAMAAHVDRFRASVRQHVGDDDEAMLIVSAMIGALILARIEPDREASDRLLKSVRQAIASLEQGSCDAKD